MVDDPVVQRVREARQQISAEFHHDVAEYVAHLRELDKQNEGRLWQGRAGVECKQTDKAV